MAVELVKREYTMRPAKAAVCIEILGPVDDPHCAVWVDDAVAPFIASSQAVRDALVGAYRQELQRIAGLSPEIN